MALTDADLPVGASVLPLEASTVSFDWSRVARYLAGHGVDLDLAFAPRRFVGGLANINMLVRADGGFAVLRRPPDGPLPKGAHDMAREHRVLHALAPVLPLAPHSLHFCNDPDIAGAPFQILEYRSGRSVRGSSLDPLPDVPETGAALSELMIDTLVRIHAVDPVAAGLGDLGRPEGFLARTAKGWIARGEAALAGHLCTAGREVAVWLEAQTPRAGPPVLLHNDFKLDNMLLHPERMEVAAVLDWDMTTQGDPFFDLATLLSYWTEQGDPPCMVALDQLPTARPGFMTREQAAQAYAARSGRSLDGFEFPRVLAVFKTAVVFHQLNILQAGNAAYAARYAALDPDDLFVFALDIARGKVF